jgi:hypothetical protein
MELACGFLFLNFDLVPRFLKNHISNAIISCCSANSHLREQPSNNTRLSGNFLMKRVIFASVLALAALGFLPNFTIAANAYDSGSIQGRIDIARIKNILKLTPEQQHYWPAVESALRGLARHQVQQPAEQSEGMISRVSNRVYSFVLDSTTIARIGAAARPLVKVLDDRQKQDAIALCHEMGLGQVLAALN